MIYSFNFLEASSYSSTIVKNSKNSTNDAGSPTNSDHHNSSDLTSSPLSNSEDSIGSANISNIANSTTITTENNTHNGIVPTSNHHSSNLTSSSSRSPKTYCPLCTWSERHRCVAREQYLAKKSGKDVLAYMRMYAPMCFIENIHFEQKKEEFASEAHPQSGNSKRNVDTLRGTSGKWVKDWNFAKRAGYIHANSITEWGISNLTLETALKRNATAWKWIDDNSPVTEISLDGFCKVCHHLDITRLFIVGDSLSRGFRFSLEALLGIPPAYSNRNKLFEYITQEQMLIPCSQSANFSGVTVAFQGIKKLEQVKALVASETPEFISTNPNNTAIIFNIGVHMKNFEEYKEGFDLMMAWFNSWKVDRSKLHAFFRESIPGHPNCTPGSQLDSNKRFQILKSDTTEPFKTYTDYIETTQENMQAQIQMKNQTSWHWYDFKYANGTIEQCNAYSKEVLFDSTRSKLTRDDELQFHWLNVYNSTILRRDGHEGFGDCLHYVLPGPPDWWVHFFYSALLDLAGYQHIASSDNET